MRFVLGAAVLAVSACTGSTTGGASPGAPVPAPGAEAPAPGAPSKPTGKAIALKPPAYTQYRLERSDTLELQLPDSSTQTQSYRWSAWINSHASAETDGYHLVLTLDSLEVAVSGVPLLQPALDSARGTRWTAHLSSDGKISSVETDRQSSVARQFQAMLRYLYPPVPGGELRSGTTWTDSATVATRAQNFDVQETGRTDYIASGPSVHGDETVLVIGGNGTFTRTGTGSQYDQPMQYQAAGQRHVTFYLATEGAPAGAEGRESSQVTVTVPAVGQSLSADQRATFRISVIRAP
ncbi:MAG TPA: hypothetical protein VFK36_06620 [Gemmatimonadales bacterium]|nr:hypothetical protein [Gemmatimonadales bacterium]